MNWHNENKELEREKYHIKASLGLGFMIQFKAKIPCNILLIPTLAFISYHY